jgi:two-component system cell cycle sensor histidine kinase/response regulator CckA
MPGGGHLRISTAAVSFASDSPQARLMKATDFAEVTVEDTGVGMTPEVKERLSEPFFTTKGVGKGTGLGLSMVYGAVKQLSGSISVRSEVGRGSTFTILLPLSQGEPGEEPGRSGPPPRGTETVLLAEDAPDVRNITRHLLEEHGYSVIEAKDGEEAAALFQANADQVALVLLDVIMPRRGGWQAYEAIKALRPQAKVLFTSGYTEEVLTVKANREQQVHFLAKPYLPFDLLWKVRDVLDG